MRTAVTMLALVVAGVVSAEPSGYRAATQDYVAALNRLTSHAPDTSLEDVYSRAARLGEALLSPPSALESMPEVEFQALRKQLPGFILNREEVLIAQPEPSYFLDLAKRYGQPVDRAFFGLQSRGRPDGVWPVYMQQQTAYSGCTLFGQGKLVDSYRGWRHFRSEFHQAYDRFVTQALADIEEQVARSTCACGDPDSVSTELAEFAAAFPESAVAGAAASRARAVREHRSTIRFNCLSG
jgi:hypothetical protein